MEAACATYARVSGATHGSAARTVHRIVTTCVEMLRDRGFADVTAADDALERIVQGSAVVSASAPCRVRVFLHYEDRIGVKAIRALPSDGDVIFVSVDGPTPVARKEADARVQFFFARQLVFNVTRHALVPKFDVVESPDRIPVTQLPRILDTDPVVQYYRWGLGTVLRVERCFGGHEPIAYYRLVSPSSA